jgi:hypothetical protein
MFACGLTISSRGKERKEKKKNKNKRCSSDLLSWHSYQILVLVLVNTLLLFFLQEERNGLGFLYPNQTFTVLVA